MELPNIPGTKSVRRFHKKAVELRKELGKGHFGKVYQAHIRDSKLPKYVAIKIIWPVIQSGQENVDLNEFRAQAYSEMYKMSLLHHENIVQLLGMVESEIPWFVCEYMKDGNLLEYLRRKPDLKDKDMIRFCYQISNGMEYLHQNKFLHKDLAARNILLDGKAVKIADMGLSSFATDKSGGSYSINGKLFAFRQAARECIVEQIYTFDTDVWAFGVLMYEIWSHGAVPYGQHATESDVRRLIVDGHNPLHIRSPECPPTITQLMINHIFLVNWTVRASFHELRLFFDGLLKGKSVQVAVKRPSITPVTTPASSPRIIEPEQDPDPGFRMRANSNTVKPRPMARAIQLRNMGTAQENSLSTPDLSDTSSSASKSQPQTSPLLQRRRGSQQPDLNRNNNGNSSSSPTTSGSSWLFPTMRGKPRTSLTPQMSLELPYDGSNKSSSTVSLYPEFIPGRFHKDKNSGSQEILF